MDGGFQAGLMDQSSGTHNPFVAEPITLPKSRVGASNDQRFMLVFIVGTYFGPDLRNEVPRKSVLQRIALGLPSYTYDQLGGSVFRLAEIESIYYYVLRKAQPSARVKLQSLYKFLQGHLAPPVKETLEDERQFTTFFPPHLHRQARYKGTYKVVENMVFINDPDITYIKPENIERFKQLTGLNDLRLDRDEARIYRHGQRMDRDEERQARFNAITEAHEHAQNGRLLPPFVSGNMQDSRKRRRRKDPSEMLTLPPPAALLKEEKSQKMQPNRIGPAMLLLPSAPTVEQWSNILKAAKPSIAFTGTAAARQAGPLIGLVDIGVCEDAYLFRIALPGVKKDQREFSCEVECDGKVMIRGTTTTGEQRVFKGSRIFQMQTQHLCPPGPFTVSFQLPGPVEPREFSGNFGSDGILEGMLWVCLAIQLQRRLEVRSPKYSEGVKLYATAMKAKSRYYLLQVTLLPTTLHFSGSSNTSCWRMWVLFAGNITLLYPYVVYMQFAESRNPIDDLNGVSLVYYLIYYHCISPGL